MLFSGLTLDVDITAFLALALILLPFLIFNGLIFKPFLKIFEQRHDRIEGAIERADLKLEQAEEKAAQFKKELDETKRKGLELRNSVRATALAAMTQRIEQEQVKIEERVGNALIEIKRAKESAMITVNAESRRLAEISAAKLLGRNI